MRPIRAPLAAAAVFLALPATAQVLPDTSRSEASSGAINNSLVRQGQNRDAAQQNQFEINSLRNQGSRTVVPPPVVAPPIAGPAPVVR